MQIPSDWKSCIRCRLHQTRTHMVFGVGNPNARIMFIGEGPGQSEDETGVPFVGPAGHLLDRLLAQVGLTRDEVYITNVVACRPPRNREPEVDEILACLPRLEGQITTINPRVLIALGKQAIETLTCQFGTVSGFLTLPGLVWKPRGVQHRTPPIPVVPMYHPSYFLRLIQADKVKARLELQGAAQILKAVSKSVLDGAFRTPRLLPF